jgi:hypothetical protein
MIFKTKLFNFFKELFIKFFNFKIIEIMRGLKQVFIPKKAPHNFSKKLRSTGNFSQIILLELKKAPHNEIDYEGPFSFLF